METTEKKELEKVRELWIRESDTLEDYKYFPVEGMLDAVDRYERALGARRRAMMREIGSVTAVIVLIAAVFLFVNIRRFDEGELEVARQGLSSDSCRMVAEAPSVESNKTIVSVRRQATVPPPKVGHEVMQREVNGGQMQTGTSGDSEKTGREVEDSPSDRGAGEIREKGRNPFFEECYCSRQCDTAEVLMRLVYYIEQGQKGGA